MQTVDHPIAPAKRTSAVARFRHGPQSFIVFENCCFDRILRLMGRCVIVLNLKYNQEKTTKSDKKAPFGCQRHFWAGPEDFPRWAVGDVIFFPAGWEGRPASNRQGSHARLEQGRPRGNDPDGGRGLRRLGTGLSLPPHRRRQADTPSRRRSAMEGGMRKTRACSKRWYGRPAGPHRPRSSGRTSQAARS